jgi:hypothetical protein
MVDMTSGKFRLILKFLIEHYKMLDNTHYMAVLAASIIITIVSYYMEPVKNDPSEINYTKHFTIFMIGGCVSYGAIYMYYNPDVVNTTVATGLLHQSITSELTKATTFKTDPKVIACLPDF